MRYALKWISFTDVIIFVMLERKHKKNCGILLQHHENISTPEAASVLCLVLGSSVGERHGHSGVSTVEGHEAGERTGASLLWKEAKRAGTKESLIWREGTKKRESGLSQWCPMTGPEEMDENLKPGGSLWTSEVVLLWSGWPSTGTGCPGKLWVSSFGDIKKPLGLDSGQSWAGDLIR